MNNQVEFFLRAQDNEEIVEPLSDFFAPLASSKINKPELVVKSAEPIHILLTIGASMGIASWAASRFLLDPLADRLEDWWKGVSFLWKKSQANRSIGITVYFHFPTDTFEVNINETSDPEALRLVWRNVQKACALYAQARGRGIKIDQIRFIPDGTNDMLIVAYVEKRPAYVIDFKSELMKKIKKAEEDRSGAIWTLGKLIQRSDYLKSLAEKGYKVSNEEIEETKRAIEATKADIRD